MQRSDRNLQLVQNPLEDQDVELFRSGDYGPKGAFTNDDIDQMIANYDPALHEAPLTIGHENEDEQPKEDDKAPSFGWLQSLKRVGDVLVGRFSQVVPAFTEMVRQGRYKKRSVGIYKTAKGWSVRHVAFLGAVPPEVKGLADIKFHDKGEVTEITFQEDVSMDKDQVKQVEDGLFTRLSAFFSEKLGSRATKELDDHSAEVKAAIEAEMKPIREEEAKRAAAFAETQKQAVIATRSARATEAIAKVKATGAWVPAFDVMGVPTLFEELAGSETTVEFSEGPTDKQVKVTRTPLEILTHFMEQHGKIVPIGKLVDPTRTIAAAKPGSTNFTETSAKADVNSVLLTETAKKIQTERKIATFGEALKLASQENPQLLIPGGAAAGAV